MRRLAVLILIYFTAWIMFGCADPLRNKDIYVQQIDPLYVISFIHFKGDKEYFLTVYDKSKQVKVVFVDLQGDDVADYAKLLKPIGDGKFEVLDSVYRVGTAHDWKEADKCLRDARQYSEEYYGGR